MKPSYLEHRPNNRDRWMVSYLDVVTILLVLFVAVAAHLHNAAEAATPPPTPPSAAASLPSRSPSTLGVIEGDLETRGLDVHQDSRGVVVSLSQALLFGPGEDHISADALAAVGSIAGVLQKIPNRVTLVGHADAVPIHNQRFNNNWELAAARGMRLLELFTSRYGIDESRLSIQSYGSYDPRSPNDTAEGRANNRRVEIVIHDDPPPTNQ